MGSHLTVVDHVTKERCTHPLHGAETEDIGGQSVEREVRRQPAEGCVVGRVGVVPRSCCGWRWCWQLDHTLLDGRFQRLPIWDKIEVRSDNFWLYWSLCSHQDPSLLSFIFLALLLIEITVGQSFIICFNSHKVGKELGVCFVLGNLRIWYRLGRTSW